MLRCTAGGRFQSSNLPPNNEFEIIIQKINIPEWTARQALAYPMIAIRRMHCANRRRLRRQSLNITESHDDRVSDIITDRHVRIASWIFILTWRSVILSLTRSNRFMNIYTILRYGACVFLHFELQNGGLKHGNVFDRKKKEFFLLKSTANWQSMSGLCWTNYPSLHVSTNCYIVFLRFHENLNCPKGPLPNWRPSLSSRISSHKQSIEAVASLHLQHACQWLVVRLRRLIGSR